MRLACKAITLRVLSGSDHALEEQIGLIFDYWLFSFLCKREMKENLNQNMLGSG